MNFSSPSHASHRVLHWLLPFVVACMCIVAALSAGAFLYVQHYENKIVPGVSVASIPLDGLTRDQAIARLTQEITTREKQGIVFQFDGKRTRLVSSKSEPLITYHINDAVDAAYQIGRAHTLAQNALIQLDARLRHHDLPFPVSINTSEVEQRLRQAFQDSLHAAVDARLSVHLDANTHHEIVETTPEQIGQDLDITRALHTLQTQAERLETADPILIAQVVTQPAVKQTDVQPLVPQAEAWINETPLKLTYEDQVWNISADMLAAWLHVSSTSEGWQLGLDPSSVQHDLGGLLKDIIKAPVDGNLTVQDGKMTAFVAPVEGFGLDTTNTVATLMDHLQTNATSTPITLTTIAPHILGDGESLGIQEVLGIGRSQFDGSPANRRKNIALGAKMVNGSLVAPGAEFSLLKTLGTIDGDHGWLQELVIKGDKTTPEFGGGLCQIGTTTFRAALKSGLPITERQNHSYRVRYYEPAGTDATIYDPAPDFRFRNDTGSWILITTDMKDNALAFTFWGTQDGRTVDQTTPKIFNIVPPPPKKEIETLDLAPGKEKCTEVAHAGADASFDYTVTYPGKEPKKVTFNSHYKPWGAVCLHGVKELSVTSTVALTSSTQPLIP